MFRMLGAISGRCGGATEYLADRILWCVLPPPVERTRAALAKRFPVFFGASTGNDLFPTLGSANAVLWPLFLIAGLLLMWPVFYAVSWILAGLSLTFEHLYPTLFPTSYPTPWPVSTQLRCILYFLGFDINVPGAWSSALNNNNVLIGFAHWLFVGLQGCQMLVSFSAWFATLRTLQLYFFDNLEGSINSNQRAVWVVAGGVPLVWLLYHSWEMQRLPVEIGDFINPFIPFMTLMNGLWFFVFVVEPAQNTWRRKREAIIWQRDAVALRAKLNLLMPHSWTNALASLRDLLEENQVSTAVRFIKHTQSYWNIINQAQNNSENGTFAEYESGWVRLEDAINKVAVAYLDVMKIRFPSKFNIEVKCDEDVRDVIVPPFLLYPLVENAVKHGVQGADVTNTVISIVANFSSMGDLVIQVNNEAPDWDDLARNRIEGWGRGQELALNQLKIFWKNATFSGTEMPHKGYTAVITVPAAELKFPAK